MTSIITGSTAHAAHQDPTQPRVIARGASVRETLIAGGITGIGTALLMWCLWFVTHLPGLSLPEGVAGLALLSALAFGAFVAGRVAPMAGRKAALAAGGAAGLSAACLNLLLIGSRLSEQPEAAPDPAAISSKADVGALHPSAAVMAIGFIAACVAVGLIAGALGGRREAVTSDGWLSTASRRRGVLAMLAAVAIAPLLLIGGLVTSTESGMAVPDWPGTFGANMFLYPIGLMAHPRIFLEHSHRLFGAMAGLVSILALLAIWTGPARARGEGVRAAIVTFMLLSIALSALVLQATERAPTIAFFAVAAIVFVVALGIAAWGVVTARTKWAAGAAFTLVCVQGMLGGVRVTANSEVFALLHGIGGQLVFAAAVALAGALAPIDHDQRHASDARAGRLAWLGVAALGCLIFQLGMGGAYRHLAMTHALWTHVGFAIVATIAVVWLGFALFATRAAGVGKWIVGVVGFQFVLGFGALLAVLGADDRGAIPTYDTLTEAPDAPVLEVLLATAHQANGALLLGLVTLGTVLGLRVARGAR
ncbi:MAG: hypothetical protein AAF138_00360 [Planctomycetota bacterium]